MDEEKSIEEIKEIVDSKRPRKYTKEDRVKNLQIAREKKQMKKQQLKESVIEPVIVETEPEPAKVIKTVKAKLDKEHKTIKPVKSIDNENDKLADIYNDIQNIKDLITEQSQKFESIVIKPKPKPKKEKKIKIENKTLNLSITDKEIDNIINDNKDNKNNKINDKKLEDFLKAFQKKDN